MRKTFISILLLGISSSLLAGCTLPFGQKSGIQITSTPQVEVLLNGKSVGKTPSIDENVKPGIYTVRLNPTETGMEPWEGKVTLRNGFLALLDRTFGQTNDQSSGYILSFEPISSKDSTEVVIVSEPASVSVVVDGSPMGFSNHTIDSIKEGDHTFSFSAPGYAEKIVRAKLSNGTRLTINLQLAIETIAPTPTPTPEATPSAQITPTPKTTSKSVTPTPTVAKTKVGTTLVPPYVEILDTPTGWLKVREKPSASGTELGKVNPGDRFAYEEASASGWFKIEYLQDKWGYVSSQYSKLVK